MVACASEEMRRGFNRSVERFPQDPALRSLAFPIGHLSVINEIARGEVGWTLEELDRRLSMGLIQASKEDMDRAVALVVPDLNELMGAAELVLLSDKDPVLWGSHKQRLKELKTVVDKVRNYQERAKATS